MSGAPRLLPALLALVACGAPPPAGPAPEEPPAGTRAIVVVRHAESWKNVTPPPDLPAEQLGALTPRGEEQARALGERLRGRGLRTVLTSPVQRARQTADLIAAALQEDEAGGAVAVRESAGLAPLGAGRTPEGEPVSMDWREARWAAGEDPRPAGGESLGDGAKRALALIEGSREDLLLVTHGDVAAALVGHAAGAPLPARWEAHEQPTGSYVELWLDAQGRWKIAARWSP